MASCCPQFAGCAATAAMLPAILGGRSTAVFCCCRCFSARPVQAGDADDPTAAFVHGPDSAAGRPSAAATDNSAPSLCRLSCAAQPWQRTYTGVFLPIFSSPFALLKALAVVAQVWTLLPSCLFARFPALPPLTGEVELGGLGGPGGAADLLPAQQRTPRAAAAAAAAAAASAAAPAGGAAGERPAAAAQDELVRGAQLGIYVDRCAAGPGLQLSVRLQPLAGWPALHERAGAPQLGAGAEEPRSWAHVPRRAGQTVCCRLKFRTAPRPALPACPRSR